MDTVGLQFKVFVERFSGPFWSNHLAATVHSGAGDQALSFEIVGIGIVRVSGNRLLERIQRLFSYVGIAPGIHQSDSQIDVIMTSMCGI